MDVGAGNVCKFYGKCNRFCWGGNSIWIRLAAGVSGEFICWWTIKLMKTKCCHCWWHRDGYVNVDELRCCCRARRFNVNGSSVDLNSCVRRRPWRNKTQIHEINPRPDLIRLYLAACVWVCVCVCVCVKKNWPWRWGTRTSKRLARFAASFICWTIHLKIWNSFSV